jgi:hypothetical protein
MAKFDEFGGEIVEDAAPDVDEFGGEIVKPSGGETAPLQAAQTSISQALKAPSASKGGLLSDVGNYLGEAVGGFGAGAVAGVPFGLGPSIVAAFSPETTEQVEQDIAAARKKSPIAFGAGSFGAELPAFLTGAGVGEKLAEKAAPTLGRVVSPTLRKAGEYLLKGAGLGGVTGTEAGVRAAVEGVPAEEALKTGLETGASMAALPGAFAAAPALVSRVPGAVGRTLQTLAPAVAPTALAVESAPFERKEGALFPTLTGDRADVTKWLLTQGAMAGGAAGEGFEKLAAKSRESIQPKLRRAAAEGMELAVNFDSTQFIEESVHEIEFEIIVAVLLTALVCWIFLGSLSSTLNVILAIPMSLLGTIAIIYFLGFTLNTFTIHARERIFGDETLTCFATAITLINCNQPIFLRHKLLL